MPRENRLHAIDHLIGSPLAMADEKYANKIWAKFQEIPALQHPQFRIKQGSALQVDLQAKTTCIRSPQGSHTEELGYNYLVAATGLRRAWPSVPQTLTKDAYLQEIRPHVKIVAQADQGVAVIGGGKRSETSHESRADALQELSASKWQQSSSSSAPSLG